ncbi:MAG: outer membrane lipoprotein carrier protein LolA [Lutibacter sp.]|jgi:outer membrane lipoprotein-sorting protein|nr:outer membrane lipoprotein carrier protein LolA [Lutibacter sp.]
MRKPLLLLGTILSFFWTYSQEISQAKALLEEVSQQTAGYTNIVLDFDHRLDNVEADVHQQASGRLSLQGERYHLDYMGIEQLFDGQYIYLIIHEDEEVIIQSPGDEESIMSPSKILSFWKSGYQITMGNLSNLDKRTVQELILTPIDSDTDIEEVVIGIDMDTKHLYQITETGKNSTVTSYLIRHFKVDQPLDDKQFTFDRENYENEKNYTISETD